MIQTQSSNSILCLKLTINPSSAGATFNTITVFMCHLACSISWLSLKNCYWEKCLKLCNVISFLFIFTAHCSKAEQQKINSRHTKNEMPSKFKEKPADTKQEQWISNGSRVYNYLKWPWRWELMPLFPITLSLHDFSFLMHFFMFSQHCTCHNYSMYMLHCGFRRNLISSHCVLYIVNG